MIETQKILENDEWIVEKIPCSETKVRFTHGNNEKLKLGFD